ncbi:hypothetical protein FB567DRAFT_543702 [Paraphoma chrysanthemicola]|uniref:C2H2-type domain-containing protein n=1 Tax=Paraphoma chrysanthemicola TaxID=798071 RepID=A0A8K0RID5_9PLEO|nr:hypothetical protein FB567DRAFT_543702 [Paraphoma chrysanthemicola]
METGDVKYGFVHKTCCFRTEPGSEMMGESLNPDDRRLQDMDHRLGPLGDYPGEIIVRSRDPISSDGLWHEHGQHFGGSLSHHGSVTDPHVGVGPIEGSLDPCDCVSATNDTMDMTTAHASGLNNSYILPTITCGDQDHEPLILSHTGDAYGIPPPNTTSNHHDGMHRIRQQDDIDILGWTDLSVNGAIEQYPTASSHCHEFQSDSWPGSERTYFDQDQAQSPNRPGGYDEYSPNYRMLLCPSPWTPLSIVGIQSAPAPLSSGWHPSTSSHRSSSTMLSTSAASSSSHRASSEMSDASRNQFSSDLTDSTLTVQLEASSVALKYSKKLGSSGACSKLKQDVEHSRYRSRKSFGIKANHLRHVILLYTLAGSSNMSFDASSPTPSFLSSISSRGPERLPCPKTGCSKTFAGTHRRGTLQRHIRLKHGEEERMYCCEAGCQKIYLRQDARLKHYRSWHPEFNAPAIVPRPHRVPSGT